MPDFKLKSEYKPAQGTSLKLLKKLVEGFEDGLKNQVLLGVTGSGKNIYNGQYYRKAKQARTYYCA